MKKDVQTAVKSVSIAALVYAAFMFLVYYIQDDTFNLVKYIFNVAVFTFFMAMIQVFRIRTLRKEEKE